MRIRLLLLATAGLACLGANGARAETGRGQQQQSDAHVGLPGPAKPAGGRGCYEITSNIVKSDVMK